MAAQLYPVDASPSCGESGSAAIGDRESRGAKTTDVVVQARERSSRRVQAAASTEFILEKGREGRVCLEKER